MEKHSARHDASYRARIRAWLINSELGLALLVTISLVVVGALMGYENNKLIPLNPSASAHYSLSPGVHLDFLSNWDGPIYLHIAQHGYTEAGLTNFFPTYPLLVRLVNFVIPSILYSGLLVAWGALVGAVYFYMKLVKHLYNLQDNREALRATLFFVLFPTAVFLFATYTESLFACFSLGAIYFALKKSYKPTAALLALATATHPTGVFVVVLIALIFMEQKASRARALATLAAGFLGILAYMVYLQFKFHTFMAFAQAQQSHSWFHFGPSGLFHLLVARNGVFLILLLITVWYWLRRRLSFAAYTFLYLCILFLSSQGLSGFGRYTLMAFPLELMLYDYFRTKSQLAYSLVLAASAIGWAYFVLQYAAGYTGG